MDYSIIPMSRFRQELALDGDKPAAMKRAVANAFSSITASSITTFVGLLALVFMRFKIGADLGFVLAKGVLCSLVCVFTLLPALILRFDGAIDKTKKKELNIPMGGLAKFSYRSRHIFALLFIPLFIGMFFLQQNTDTAYTLSTKDPIADVFPKTSTMVILYNNRDEEKIAQLSDKMEADENIQTVLNYSTTLRRKCPVQQLSDLTKEMGGGLELDPSLLNIVYYEYFNGTTGSMTVSQFLNFVSNEIAPNPQFSGYISGDMRGSLDQIGKFSNPEALTAPQSPAYIGDMFGIDAEQVSQLIMYRNMQSGADSGVSMTVPRFAEFIATDVLTNPQYTSNIDTDFLSLLRDIADPARIKTIPALAQALLTGRSLSAAEMANALGMGESEVNSIYWLYASESGALGEGSISVRDFVDFLDDVVLTDPQYASQFDAENAQQLRSARGLIDAVADGASYDAPGMANLLSGFGAGIDRGSMELLYTYYASRYNTDPQWELSLLDLFSFVSDDIVNDPRFASFITPDMKTQIADYKTQMTDGVNQLVGENHSIFTLYSWYPPEGEETTKFFDDLTAWCDENLEGDYYLIGDSAMSYEMAQSFKSELLSITLLTAIAIFLVVLAVGYLTLYTSNLGTLHTGSKVTILVF